LKYSLVNGTSQEATPKQKGVCCFCGSPTISKCGNRKVWHWAHESLTHCDSWWENETSWHRLWKSYFPKENQEVVHFDEVTGEKHIADIKTKNGIVIEIQNSPMSEEELRARECFYGKMMWIVNGEKFKNNLIILSRLPNPTCVFFKDIVFRKVKFNKRLAIQDHLICSQNFGDSLITNYNFIQKCKQEIDENYIGDHLFEWKKPRSVWFKASKPVLIDFGYDVLWWLKKYSNDRDLWCVKKISKEALVRKNGGEYTQ